MRGLRRGDEGQYSGQLRVAALFARGDAALGCLALGRDKSVDVRRIRDGAHGRARIVCRHRRAMLDMLLTKGGQGIPQLLLVLRNRVQNGVIVGDEGSFGFAHHHGQGRGIRSLLDEVRLDRIIATSDENHGWRDRPEDEESPPSQAGRCTVADG